MQIQVQPNRASCLITSFAMVLDESVEELIKEVGHDGMTILWDHLPPPYCYQAFHIQEMVELCLSRKYFVTPYEALPSSYPSVHETAHILRDVHEATKRINKILNLYKGVLVGETSFGKPHAVAWNKNQIFDPIGETYFIDKFTISTFWIVHPFTHIIKKE